MGRLSGFWFLVSGFRFRVQSFGFRVHVSCPVFRSRTISSWVSYLVFRVSCVVFRVSCFVSCAPVNKLKCLGFRFGAWGFGCMGFTRSYLCLFRSLQGYLAYKKPSHPRNLHHALRVSGAWGVRFRRVRPWEGTTRPSSSTFLLPGSELSVSDFGVCIHPGDNPGANRWLL